MQSLLEHLGQISQDLWGAMEAEPMMKAQLAHREHEPAPSFRGRGDSAVSDDLSFRARISHLLALSTTPIDHAGISCLLKHALGEADARVRGVALVLISDHWASSGNHMIVEEVAAALAERFGVITNSILKTPEAVARHWLEHLAPLVRTARKAASHGPARMYAARANADKTRSELQNDPAAVDRYLTDSDPAKKIAAIMELPRHQSWSQSTVEQVIAVAKRDPVAFLRRDAVFALSSRFRGSNDTKVLRVLAGIVEDQAECPEVRCHAYLGLIGVGGGPADELPIVERDGRVKLHLDRVMDCVNWAFVHACAAEKATGAAES